MERIRKKRVLIHSIVFSPDSVSTAYLYNDISIGLKDAGYDIIVLTTTPHYNIVESLIEKQPLIKRFYGLFYESDFNGIRVIHVPLKKFKNTLLRILSFVYWHFTSLIIGYRIKNIDFILSPSPPISIGLVSILIAKKHKAKFIYNVQEIYPDLIIKNGLIKSKILIKSLKLIEKYVYNNSSSVITIDQNFYDQIIDRFNDKTKLKIIPNFVDTEIYKPIMHNIDLPYPFSRNSNKIRLLYAGNIGIYQDWEPVLYAAKQLNKTNINIEFWIIGEGVKKKYLLNEIQRNKLSNIKIFPYQERKLMPIINSIADIHFIVISKEMENEGFPSKVYTIMACEKPMIVITGYKTPLYNFLNSINCAILITKDKNINFYNEIVKLSSLKSKQKLLGKNGFREINKKYTKKIILEMYTSLFLNI